MALYVLDANVAVKWFVPEAWSYEARRLLSASNRFIEPDFMPTEVMNAMLRKHRKGEVIEAEVLRAGAAIREAFELVVSEPYLERAVRLSLDRQRDAFDGIYVTLALEMGCPFITSDRPLYNALAPHYPGTMLWIEDVPA